MDGPLSARVSLQPGGPSPLLNRCTSVMTALNDKPRIAVLGSINMDLLIRLEQLPAPGETRIAESATEVCGGKGANQAVAAARAGGSVVMIGRVGNDTFAPRLRQNLIDAPIDCQHVHSSPGASGLAVVNVDQNGENSIVVVPGANATVSVADVESARQAIVSADTLLVQLETPLETVVAAVRLARSADVRVILDPAPPPSQFPDELLEVDLICPNQSEASALSGSPITSISEAVSAAARLHDRGASRVAITLGESGTLLFDASGGRHLKPPTVTPIDTTAAGDAFAGALAVRWCETEDLDAAVGFANAAGAWAAAHRGAQPAMGTRAQVETLWTPP